MSPNPTPREKRRQRLQDTPDKPPLRCQTCGKLFGQEPDRCQCGIWDKW